MADTDDATLRSAIEKTKNRQKLTREEQRAFTAAKKRQEEQLRTQLLRNVPKKVFCELAARQHKQVNEQGDAHGLPTRGETIDLFLFIRAVFDLLAKHGHKLLREEDDDDPGGDSIWLEEQRKQKALKTRLERLEMESQLLRRDVVHNMLARCASLIQNAGEQLQRQGNADGFEVLNETVVAMQREIETELSDLPPLSDELNPTPDTY